MLSCSAFKPVNKVFFCCHSWHFVNEIILIGLILVNVLGSFCAWNCGENNSTEIYIYIRKNANQRNLINKAIESFDIGPREAHVW